MNGHTATVVALLKRRAYIYARDKVSSSRDDVVMLCTYPLGKGMRTVCAMCCTIDSQIIWVHHVMYPMSDDVVWPYCTSPLINEWPHSYCGSSTG